MIVRCGLRIDDFPARLLRHFPAGGILEDFSAPRALKMGQRIDLITVRTHAECRTALAPYVISPSEIAVWTGVE